MSGAENTRSDSILVGSRIKIHPLVHVKYNNVTHAMSVIDGKNIDQDRFGYIDLDWHEGEAYLTRIVISLERHTYSDDVILLSKDPHKQFNEKANIEFKKYTKDYLAGKLTK